MNWKKLLLIAVITGGVAFAAAPRAEAGLSVGIGIGVPVGYGYGYGGYYGGYRRASYYPYGYGYSPYGYSRYGYHRPVRVVIRPHYHRYHGRRVYCTERHRRWR